MSIIIDTCHVRSFVELFVKRQQLRMPVYIGQRARGDNVKVRGVTVASGRP